MEKLNAIKIINEEKKEDNITIQNKKEPSFERLCKLQKLIKEESMLKELCKIYYKKYNYFN